MSEYKYVECELVEGLLKIKRFISKEEYEDNKLEESFFIINPSDWEEVF